MESINQPSEQELFENNVTFMLQAVRTGIPGKIVKTDGQKATVIPTVKRLFKGKPIDPVAIPNVPIWRLGTKTARVTVPLNKQGGDFCLIMFAERPIDTWAAGDGSPKAPKDGGHHDTRGAWCLVGLEPFTAAAVDTENLVVEMNRDKPANYCSMTLAPTGVIKMVSPKEIILDTPVVKCTGNIEAAKEVQDKIGTLDRLRQNYNTATYIGNLGAPTSITNKVDA